MSPVEFSIYFGVCVQWMAMITIVSQGDSGETCLAHVCDLPYGCEHGTTQTVVFHSSGMVMSGSITVAIPTYHVVQFFS